MDEMETLAGSIFSLLKGNGFKIKVFDVDGNSIPVPKNGRRFFVTRPNIMITIDEENEKVEFNKGSNVEGDDIDRLQQNIRRLATTAPKPLNFTTKVFGKTIQPRNFAYQAKTQKDSTVMENNVKPRNHKLQADILHKVEYFKNAEAYTIADELGLSLRQVQPELNNLVTNGKIKATPTAHGSVEYSVAVEEAVFEDNSTDTKQKAEKRDQALAKYKTAAAADAGKADKEGDIKRADKRFSGIIKATHKQFANDPKRFAEEINESFSKMFGSARTSQQTLENVRILVKHKTPVNEESRGARSRHISSIFLECNGERFRFPHNYLAGARAMAQHMAHGGTMSDKVGAYIAESTGQLLKLQSFNRYVTTNNLINEDSSGIVETVKENIQTIRTELKKLTGVKTYETVKARLETFERQQLDENDTTQLKELFTIRRFDEKFEEVLPIVKQLVQERDTFHKRIEEAASGSITLRREAISAVPMMEFASENARLGFKLNELALRIVENDELAGFINKIGTKMCKEGTMNDFEKAVLTQVFENAKVEEKKEAKEKELKESVDLETFYNKFDYTFM